MVPKGVRGGLLSEYPQSGQLPVESPLTCAATKESSEGRIELHDDEPHSVFDLISTFYGYDGYDKTCMTASTRGAEDLVSVVELYVTSTKYMVPGLASRIAQDFGDMLNYCIGHTGLFPIRLERVFKQVYITHVNAAKPLRQPIAESVAAHAHEWRRAKAFRRLLEDVPQLAYEVIVTATKLEAPPTKPEGTAASVKKQGKWPASNDDDNVNTMRLGQDQQSTSAVPRADSACSVKSHSSESTEFPSFAGAQFDREMAGGVLLDMKMAEPIPYHPPMSESPKFVPENTMPYPEPKFLPDKPHVCVDRRIQNVLAGERDDGLDRRFLVGARGIGLGRSVAAGEEGLGVFTMEI